MRAAAAAPALPLRRDRRAMISFAALGLLATLTLQVTSLAAPLLALHIFDGVLESRNTDTLWAIALVYAVAVALSGVLRYLRASLVSGAAERLARHVYVQAVVTSVRSALAGDTGRSAMALQDGSELRRLLGSSAVSDLLDQMLVPLALVFLFILHPLFFAISLAAATLMAMLGLAAERAARGNVAVSSAANSRCSASLSDRLRQSDLIAGLGMLRPVLARWQPEQLRALDRQSEAQRVALLIRCLAQVVTYGETIAIIGVGAWLLLDNVISPGALIAAKMVSSLARMPMVQVMGRCQDWILFAVTWRRLAGVVAATSAPQPAPRDDAVPPGLVVERLTLRLLASEGALVADLDLALAPGEALAVVGRNGAGKTTLLRAVAGIAAPASGRALLDGRDTFRTERSELGPCIGYLPQDPQLLEGTVLENIVRFDAECEVSAAVAASRRAGVHDAIGRFPQGYATPLGARAGVSVGQQRMVGLARAFYGAPGLLLLDEPEAGLDPATLELLRAGIVEAKAEGAAVLIATHQPETWAGVTDGTLRLRPGGGWVLERIGGRKLLTDEGGRTQ